MNPGQPGAEPDVVTMAPTMPAALIVGLVLRREACPGELSQLQSPVPSAVAPIPAPPGVAGNLPPLQADESRTRSGAQRSGMRSSPNADIGMPPYLGTVGG